MKAAGFRLGCITNKLARYTEPLLKGIGLAKYFEIVLSGDTLPEKKPHPMPLLHAGKIFRRAGRKNAADRRFAQRYPSPRAPPVARCSACLTATITANRSTSLDLDAVIADLPAALPLIKRA